MSFGFSAGDFLAAAQLAHKIRKDFIGAPSQFKSLSDEAKLLSMVLQDVDVKVDESDLTEQQEANLEQAMSTCEAVLDDLQAICDNFSELDTAQGQSHRSIRRVWKKLKWEPNEARELRERISSSIAMLTALLNQLSSETTIAVKEGVDRLNQGQDRRERLIILNWLSSFDHTAQQNDISARRQAGTGGWLLESPEFISWKSTKGETLFCPGIPGAGKTILSSIVVEKLIEQFQDDSSICIAHVYFNYQQQESQTVSQVFASLLRQIVGSQVEIPAPVRYLYEKNLKREFKLDLEEVSGLLHSLSSLCSRVFIIIDALDECPSRDGRRNALLSEIMKLQSALSANMLCTSRPIPEIEAWFSKAVSINVRASEHDVRKYLDGQLGRLPGFVTRNPALQERVKKQIVQVVDGMFLLAHLHLESLMYKRTAKALGKALEGLPRGSAAYDDTYKKTMERIEAQFPDQAELAKDTLQWIICAKTPLSVSGLQHALAVESGEGDLDFDNLPDADDMVTACGGLVAIDQKSGIIRLVHYTTQEYFERTKGAWFPAAEEQMADVCLAYLSFQPFRREQCKTPSEYRRRLEDWPFYRYACKYWAVHASQTAPARILAFFQLKQAFRSSLQPFFEDRTGSIYTEHYVISKPFDSVKNQVTALHMAALFGFVDVARKLANPESVDQQTINGWTPLAFAAEQGYDEIIRLLLVEHGAKANLQDEDGIAPLHRTVSCCHASSSKLLLEFGKADMWLKDFRGETPLHLAIIRGQVEIFEYFAENLEAYPGSELQLGLMLRTAAVRGRVGIVKLLISRTHLDLNISGDTIFPWAYPGQRPPLAWAAYYRSYEVCKVLVETGRVDPNVVDSTGRTALSYAIERNSTKIMDMLLQVNNIYVGSTEPEDYLSPLSFAVTQGNEEIVRKLFATNRACPNPSLLRMAISSECSGVASVLLSGPTFDTNAKDGQGRTPLSYASEKGDMRIVESLLRYNAAVNSTDFQGRSPLSYASQKGDTRIVEALLRHNANVNSKDLQQRTPLSYAADHGHDEVVDTLLRMPNIDVDSKSRSTAGYFTGRFAGCTPLAFAAFRGHPRIVRRLLDTGQVDPDSKSSSKSHCRTPLAWAIEGSCGFVWDGGGNEAVANLLLRTKRVDVNSKSAALRPDSPNDIREDQTPLLIATREPTPLGIVQLLLENGADVNAASADGSTPLSNAVELQRRALADSLLFECGSLDAKTRLIERKGVVDLLLEYGAKPLE